MSTHTITEDWVGNLDAYEVRCLAGALIAEDRVSTDELRDIIRQYGQDDESAE